MQVLFAAWITILVSLLSFKSPGPGLECNNEKVTFDLVSLVIVLCGFLSMGLIIVPERDDQMVKSLTASLVSREEEERHQRNLNEDEQLKNQIAEMEE
ncbi:hypothetical protein RRG08_050224 [Elysia crispata]|uniref:Uncharacterized protein n=1 Tax=Elysia crispata TaxID=231223 RepID=A0AAE1AT60_9GAST|nr:hypothetical protein RRG08_050224 [Elysia crispata]